MGLFHQQIEVANLDQETSILIDAVVDTGTFYTMLPRDVLRALRVEPLDSRLFELADGSLVEMQFGHIWVTIGDQRIITIVTFGENEGPSLLGAYTLEGLALEVDPVGERLVPRRLLLV